MELIKFTKMDIECFRDFSFDVNPLHLDKEYARKTFYGKPIVYGALVAIKCIGRCREMRSTTGSIDEINIQFHEPVFINNTYQLHEEFLECKTKFYLADDSGNKLLTGSIVHNTYEQQEEELIEDKLFVYPLAPDQLTDMEIERFVTADFQPFNVDKFINLNASLGVNLNAKIAYGLATSSYLIGMKCPGLYSIFTRCKLKFHSNLGHKENLAETKMFSHNLLQIDVVHKWFTGTLEAIQRPKPIRPIGIEEVQQLLVGGKMLGKKTLIVGGSRGLGALMTKIMIVARADVTFSYFDGGQDAATLLKEAQDHGYSVDAFQLNVLIMDGSLSESVNDKKFDYILYFASPRLIFNKSAWRSKLYETYKAYYVDGMINLLENRLCCNLAEGAKVFLPSTIAITENTLGLSEYILAKQEAEAALISLSKTNKVEHVIERLPLLPTELTNRPNVSFSENPIDTLLGVFSKLL